IRPPNSPTIGCLDLSDPACKDPDDSGFVAPVVTENGQIQLAIDQTIKMERQAYNAMLGIGARTTLTNAVATIQVREMSGADASSKFFTVVTSDPLGATHGGTISTSASVSWQLIPNSDAGGTNPSGRQYNVQATLNFMVNGVPKTAITQVVTITVLPSPKLELAYS